MEGSLVKDVHTREAEPAITRVEVRRVARLVLRLAQFVGRGICALLFATLAVLEPLVRLLLTSLATLGMFVTIVFGFLLGTEGFPRWLMLGFSGGCFLILLMYYLAMRVFGNFGTRPI
jgi:hypothetical protein